MKGVRRRAGGGFSKSGTGALSLGRTLEILMGIRYNQRNYIGGLESWQ